MAHFFHNPLSFSPEDFATIGSIAEEAAKYKPAEGRYNPFTGSRIVSLLENNAYSEFLKKTIETVEEAAWHGKYETELWHQQDINNKIQRNKVLNNNRQKTFRDRKSNPEIEEAKQKWKEAVAQRNAAIEQWNVYVEQFRLAYNVVKLKAQQEGEQNDNQT